jgi:uncharacterized repeat protein (TIGR01451 family)
MAIFSNQATLTYNGISTNSNIAYGEILETLSVTKTAIEDGYSAGSTITYAVTLKNTGTSPLSGITVSDDLGGYLVGSTTVYPLTYQDGSATLFIDGVPQAAPAVVAGPPLVFSGINLPGNSDAVLIYQATVNGFANPNADGVIDNTVTVSGGGLTSEITAVASVPVTVAPVLSISKSITPSQVVDNDRVTYTFIIQNTGNQAVLATDNAAISDIFDPILTALTVMFNGTAWSEGIQYSYDETTGDFSTNNGQITVPAATYIQDPTTGEYTVTPGTSTLIVTGTI